MQKFMLASEFAKQRFEEGSRPAMRTLQRWINDGDIPGRRIGGRYYVNKQAFDAMGDDLVLKVLRNEPPAS